MDLLQEVMLKVHRSLGSFREDAQFKTWIYRIAVNRAISFLRRRRVRSLFRERVLRERAAGAAEPPGSDTLELLIEAQERQRVAQAIERLPARQRATVHLRIVEGETYAAIAEIMGCSVGTAKANFHHAVKRLRKELRENPDEMQPARTSLA